MLLKYHPELQFRPQSYKHSRTYIALFLYKRKLVASIHVNKIICILTCFQDQTFSLQFLMYSGVTQAHLKLYCVRQMQAHKWAWGPYDAPALGHFSSCKQSRQGQHRRTWLLEPQADTLASLDTVQVMQRSCSFYFHPLAQHQWGCWIPKLQWEGWQEHCYQTYQKLKWSGIRPQWRGHKGMGNGSLYLQ